MPTPQKNQSRADYLKICIPQLIREGKSKDQAIAQCYSMFKQAKNKRISKALKGKKKKNKR